MTSAHRLVVLTSADPPGLADPLQQCLASWCEAGVLGNVVWCPASALVSGDAECWASDEVGWVKTTLRDALGARVLSEVWLAALRHPKGEPSGGSAPPNREAENRAYETLAGMLGAGLRFQSMTVGVAAESGSYGMADFSPLWDFHLLHDRKAEAHHNAPLDEAAESSPLGLCAMVALCAAGGWRGDPAALDITDRADGPVKPVRFVHAQTRLLYTPPLAHFDLPSAPPTLPPWPLPSSAGVARAQPGSVPPHEVVEKLAAACGFGCMPLQHHPIEGGPSMKFVRTGLAYSPVGYLWRGLFSNIPAPLPRSDHEKALRRLAGRTGGWNETREHEEFVRAKLDGVDNVIDLAGEIQRSEFPTSDGSLVSHRPTPEVWETLRETLLGLVDGGPMPDGIPAPTMRERQDVWRLVWADPNAVAPKHVDSDASDIFLGAAPDLESTYRLIGNPEGLEGTEPEDQGQEDPDDGDNAGLFAGESTGTDKEEDQQIGDTWLAEVDSAAPVGGDHDTVMARLAHALHRSIAQARDGFRNYAVAFAVNHQEHSQAVKAQRRSRLYLKLLLAGLVVAAMFPIENRWGIFSKVWEFITPWGAWDVSGSSFWPIGWIIIGILAFIAWIVLFVLSARKLIKLVGKLESENALRQHIGISVSHFASELLRLRGIADQFADHRRVIAEVLHRPFGDYGQSENNNFRAANLRFTVEPPSSMLVARADLIADQVVAVRQDRVQSAFRSGWLAGVYQDVYRIWNERYRRRIVGHVEAPDSDTSLPGMVIQHDRHDQSPIYAPRMDFTQSVVDEKWVTRIAASRFFENIFIDSSQDVSKHLAALTALAPIHGSPAGVGETASRFFDLGERNHWFSWESMLAPGSSAPRIETQVVGGPRIMSNPVADHSCVLAWCLELSDPVEPEDLAGWSYTDGDDGFDSTRKPIV